MPTIWDSEKNGADNPFLNLFTSIDIVLVFQGVLSLLALIFAYDALAGERERGTLRLVLTHPIQRGYILCAKYISAMLCLLVPLLISLLLSIILLTTSTMVALNTDDFLRIGGIVLTSLLYVSLFYLIGLMHLCDDASNQYRAHALHVRLGSLSARVSKSDSYGS